MVLRGFLAAVAFAVAISAVSFWLQMRSGQAQTNVDYDQSVLHAVDLVLQSEINAETGQRGYLLTSNPAYLAPYQAGTAAVRGDIALLQSLLPDNAANRAAMLALNTQSSVKLAEMARTIALDKTLGFGAAQDLVDNNSGQKALNQIRELLGQLSTAYGGKVVLQRQEAQSLMRRTSAALLASGLVMAGLMFWACRRIFQDVRRLTIEQKAVLKANETLYLAKQSGGIGTWDWDILRDRMTWDDWMCRLYGVDPESECATAQFWSSLLHPEDRAAAERAIADALAGIRKFDVGFRVVWHDGSVHHIRATGTVTRKGTGEALRMVGVNWDVTAQFVQNLALQEATTRMVLAADSNGIGIWEWDILHGTVDWDSRTRQLFDVDPAVQTVTYELWKSRLHPEDHDAAVQALASAAAGSSRFDTRFRTVWRDGSVHEIRSVAEVKGDADGTVLRMLGVNWDVTKEMMENIALKVATERLQLAADGGEIGILELDLRNNSMVADEWACRIFGIAYSPGIAVPADIWKLRVHPEDRARRDQALQDAIDRVAPFALEYRIIRNDGIVRHLKCSAVISRDAAGQAIRNTGSVQDITPRKQIEEALAKTAKELAVKAVALAENAQELKRSNEELSQFAAIASHDLQEPLRMVASYTQLIATRYKGRLDKDADEFIAYAVDGAKRMQGLIKDLLAYSRVGTNGVDLRCTASTAALTGALWNLEGAIAESGAVVTHDVLPAVLADASQLTQLFQNLVGNAIKYRGAGIPHIHVSATFAAGRWRFDIKDNGLGIETQHFERIFGMFQRLHGVDEYSGTGIGLAICKKIVDRHGGVIGVHSAPGAGSCFYFTLAPTPGAPKLGAPKPGAPTQAPRENQALPVLGH
jgi:PAS domain S-box-containing protein